MQLVKGVDEQIQKENNRLKRFINSTVTPHWGWLLIALITALLVAPSLVWATPIAVSNGAPQNAPAAALLGTWASLPNLGLNGRVNDIAVMGSDVYVGGDFTQTADGSVTNLNYIAKFSGGAWAALPGNGLSSSVFALTVVGTDLYVGGDFTQSADGSVTNLNHIAKLTTPSTGTIIIEKQTVPAGGFDFGFVITNTVGVATSFALSDTEQFTLPNVPLGTYTVTEDASTGSFLSGLRCNDGTSTVPSTWDIATRTATIGLDPGETVTCIFTNSEDDVIIIEKATLPSGGTGFGFSSDIPGSATFTLDDFEQNITAVTPGTYTITETNSGPGYDLTAIECAVFGPGPDDFTTVSGDINAGRVSVPLTTAGQGAHCIFENTKLASITVVKNTEGGMAPSTSPAKPWATSA